ncbi:MAG: hypothetical protein HN929_10560, partial [Chloroflexi bacterium]|nr:hypothetical protein [Chloroflexota bacterium]
YMGTGTSIKISVPDTTPPTLTAPADATVQASGLNSGSYVVPAPTAATDIVDGDVSDTISITVDGAGSYSVGDTISNLTIGAHTLVWNASDTSSNDASDSQTVTVTANTASQITTSGTRVMSADGTDSLSLTATIQDTHGNTITDATDDVTFTVTTPAASATFDDTTSSAVAGVASSTLQTTYSDGSDTTFVVTVSVSGVTSASDTISVNTFSLSNTGGTKLSTSMAYYVTADATLTLNLAGGDASTTWSAVNGGLVANATDTNVYTPASLGTATSATDTITVTGSVANSDATTTLNLVIMNPVAISSPGATAQAYMHGADPMAVLATGGDGSYIYTINPQSGVDNAVAAFVDATGTPVNTTNHHTCTGSSGDCIVKMAEPFSLSQSSVDNTIKLKVGSTTNVVSMSSTGEVVSSSFSDVSTDDSIEVTFNLDGFVGDATGTIGFAVEDLSGNGRKIYAVLDHASMSGGSISVDASATLSVYGVKGDGSPAQATFTNAAQNIITVDATDMTVNLTNLRDNVQQAFVAQGFSSDLSSFADPTGYYNYMIFIDDSFPVSYKTSTGTYTNLYKVDASDITTVFDSTGLTTSSLVDSQLLYGTVQINSAEASDTATTLTGLSRSSSAATGKFNIHVAETTGRHYLTDSSVMAMNDATSSDIEVFAATSVAVSINGITTTALKLAADATTSLAVTGTSGSFSFASSDSSVFTVAPSTGVITAVGPGSATLTITDASYSNISTSLVVTIIAASADPINVTSDGWSTNSATERMTVQAGETRKINLDINSGSVSVTAPNSVSSTASISAGVLTWTAPSIGAFAGDYTLTITDISGNTKPLYITVPYGIAVKSIGSDTTNAKGMLASETAIVQVTGGVSGDTMSFSILDSAGVVDASDTPLIADVSGTATFSVDGSDNVALALVDPTDTLTAVTEFQVKATDGTDTATLSGLQIFPVDTYTFTTDASGTVTITAQGIVNRNGVSYSDSTDSGSLTITLPKYPISGSFHRFVAT